MSSKLFKIGEYAAHGKWKVIVNPETSAVVFCGIDWNTDKEVERIEFTYPTRNQLVESLTEVMSSYWAEKIIEYVETVTTLTQPTFTMFSNL